MIPFSEIVNYTRNPIEGIRIGTHSIPLSTDRTAPTATQSWVSDWSADLLIKIYLSPRQRTYSLPFTSSVYFFILHPSIESHTISMNGLFLLFSTAAAGQDEPRDHHPHPNIWSICHETMSQIRLGRKNKSSCIDDSGHEMMEIKRENHIEGRTKGRAGVVILPENWSLLSWTRVSWKMGNLDGFLDQNRREIWLDSWWSLA